MSAILDIQCVLDEHSKYLIKEMSVLDMNDSDTQHWIFKNSCTKNAKSRCVNKWLERNYHQLSLECGDVEYSELGQILSSLNFTRIYVKGAQKREIIKKFIPQMEVIDMAEEMDCPRLNQLHCFTDLFQCCTYHKNLNRTQCTLYKVFILRKWFNNNIF